MATAKRSKATAKTKTKMPAKPAPAHAAKGKAKPAPKAKIAVRVALKPKRAGFSPDLGFLPVDPEVRWIAETAARRLTDAGATVELAAPDFAGARETFRALRALRYVTVLGPAYP